MKVPYYDRPELWAQSNEHTNNFYGSLNQAGLGGMGTDNHFGQNLQQHGTTKVLSRSFVATSWTTGKLSSIMQVAGTPDF